MGRYLELIGVILVCLAVLSLEQAYGVPFIVFFLILELSFRFSFWERVWLWTILGVGLAALFNLPLSWGVACVFILTGAYIFFQPALRGIHLRAILISLIGSLVIANLSQVTLSSTTLVMLAVSVVGTVVLARQFFWSRELKVV